MKADLGEIEENAPRRRSDAGALAHIQRELDDCRRRVKQAEETVLAQLPQALLLTDRQGRIIDANPAVCALLGYEKNELCETDTWIFMTSPGRDTFLKRLRDKIFLGQSALHVVCERKNGARLTLGIELADFSQNGRDLLAVCCRDLTEQNQLEQRIYRSEAVLAETQHLSLTGSFSWQVSTGEIHWSDETFRIFGYEPVVKPTIEMARRRIYPEDIPEFEPG